MANHKANEPRVLIRVPMSFRKKVMDKAKEQQIDATLMLERSTIVYNPMED